MLRQLLRTLTPPTLRAPLRSFARGIWRRARGLPSEDIERWEQRVDQFGARAVFNLGHSSSELQAVTDLQKATLYPLFRDLLNPNEKLVLDLGCGSGRFTCDLAQLTGGHVLGVDPIQKLLDLAPRAPAVEYRCMVEGRIPAGDHAMDVVWICLVLGGLRDDVLTATIDEVHRVLRPGGLIFLVENTTAAPDSPFWRFRTANRYQKLFRPVTLSHLEDYFDLDERISVLAGRSRT